MAYFRKRLSPNAAKIEVVEWVIEAMKGKFQVELWIEENSFGDILGENFQDELRRRGVVLGAGCPGDGHDRTARTPSRGTED